MISKQEMLNRAVRGLRSQGWKQALTQGGKCAYLTLGGCRCAWGWVDPDGTGTGEVSGTVGWIARQGIGIAATLDEDHLRFASALQSEHDTPSHAPRGDHVDVPPRFLEASFRKFANEHALEFPEE